MAYFNNIFLVKAPQAVEASATQNLSDYTEICYLAATVEHDVESVTMPVDFNNPQAFHQFEHALTTCPVDLVGISSMTGAFHNALKLARMAKRHQKLVLMGGYHPSALPEEVLKSPDVDAVIIGEGELTFRELVLSGPSKEVAGLAYKEDGGIIFTGLRSVVDDLDSLPQPLRRIRPARFGEKGDDYSIDTVYTSRGCRWQCTFCANNLINKTWRARSPENVVEELGQLHKKGRKKLIKIWDANFFGDINRVEKICYLMLERGLTKFKIWTEARVDDIIRAQPILRDLYRVGLRSVSLGLESPLPQTLRLMKKSITIDKCQEAVAILRKYWIKPQGYFIIGHHSETEEDTKRYPEYAEKLWLHNTVFMAMTPYPGTEVFEEYSRQNLIRSFNWDLYNNFVPVVETRSIDLKTLRRLYAYCYGKFYLDRFLLAKCRNFPDTIASLLGRLHMIHLIARMNTETTREECKDFMYEAVRTGVGRRFQTALQPKFSLMLALFRSFTIRIKRSPGRQVDIKISSAGKGRNYFIAETQEAGPVKGPVLDLEEIIGLGDRISPRRLTELDNESEILKLSSGLSRVTGRIFLNEFFSHSDLIFLAVFFLKHIGNAFLRVLCYPFSKA